MHTKNETRIATLASLIGADPEALTKRVSHDTREVTLLADGMLDSGKPNKDGLVTVKKKGGSVKKVKETHALRLLAISNALADLEEMGLTVEKACLSSDLAKTENFAMEAEGWLKEARAKRDAAKEEVEA
jgi:hypothetical protein